MRERHALATKRLREHNVYRISDNGWEAAINCPPSGVDVRFHYTHCGRTHTCPFCHSRRFLELYSRCLSVLDFGPRLGYTRKSIIVSRQRWRTTCSTVEDAQAAMGEYMGVATGSRTRVTRLLTDFPAASSLRYNKFWIRRLTNRSLRVFFERITLLIIPYCHYPIPVSLILPTRLDDASNRVDGMVLNSVAMGRELHRDTFRKWFIRVMSFPSALITDDVEVLLAQHRAIVAARVHFTTTTGDLRHHEES